MLFHEKKKKFAIVDQYSCRYSTYQQAWIAQQQLWLLKPVSSRRSSLFGLQTTKLNKKKGQKLNTYKIMQITRSEFISVLKRYSTVNLCLLGSQRQTNCSRTVFKINNNNTFSAQLSIKMFKCA